ncbi:MAG: metallophosphoesterase, partial [Chitinophagaceae bacterium]
MRSVTILILFVFLFGNGKGQDFDIILGRPTNTAITMSILFSQPAELQIRYGTVSGKYETNTSSYLMQANVPNEIEISGLLPNTKYFYSLSYKLGNSSSWKNSSEFYFQTQRSPGEEFVFTVESDEHLYDKKGIRNMYKVTLQNQLNDKPDFMFSLGDIFGDDHDPYGITSEDLKLLHKDYRQYLGSICHSIPFFIALGNHEGENDFYLSKNPPNNLAVWGTLWRKYYYPNPYPNAFYNGNTDQEPYEIGYPENYYSFVWGDALFVVLDVYRYQNVNSEKPQNWDWTIGQKQYNWLKTTLESSSSKYKFVFAHHVRGQGRGGITNAKLFEWGGYESDGKTWGFDKNRPGWGKPIHQLFKDNGVNIFFQGHDHLFAHEVMDNVHYQEVPMPSDSTYTIGMLANADSYTSDTVDGTGHIRIKVSSSCIKVDYVKAYLPNDTLGTQNKNGQIGFSYTIGNCTAVDIDN